MKSLNKNVTVTNVTEIKKIHTFFNDIINPDQQTDFPNKRSLISEIGQEMANKKKLKKDNSNNSIVNSSEIPAHGKVSPTKFSSVKDGSSQTIFSAKEESSQTQLSLLNVDIEAATKSNLLEKEDKSQ